MSGFGVGVPAPGTIAKVGTNVCTRFGETRGFPGTKRAERDSGEILFGEVGM